MLVCSCSTSRTQPITTTSFWGKPERKRSLEPGEGVTRPGGGTSHADSVLKHGSPETLMPTCNIHGAFDGSKAGIVQSSLNISWVALHWDFGDGFLHYHRSPTLPWSLSYPVWRKSDDTLICSQRVPQK